MAYPKKFVDLEHLESYCLGMSKLNMIPNPAVIIPKDLYDDVCITFMGRKIEVINDNGDGTITVRIMMERPYEKKEGNVR